MGFFLSNIQSKAIILIFLLLGTKSYSQTNSTYSGALRTSNVSKLNGSVSTIIPICSIGAYSLELHYNSKNVEKDASTPNVEKATSIIGLGWSINDNKIVRNNNGTGDEMDDKYYLNIGGSISQLEYTEKGQDDKGAYKRYISKNNADWNVYYYNLYDQWKIVFDDGMTTIFGDGNLYDNYNCNSSSKGVSWGNWIGTSIESTNQQNYTTEWNCAQIISLNGERTRFVYESITEKVGINGLFYTKATYLSEVWSSRNGSIKLNYSDKLSTEYADPHTENNSNINNDFDAYQELFETKYLSSVSLFFENNGILDKTIKLDYKILKKSDSDDKFVKRCLTSIAILNSIGVQRQPEHKFDYYGLTSTDDVYTGLTFNESRLLNEQNGALYGALKTETQPTGLTYLYQYSKQNQENSMREIDLTFPQNATYTSYLLDHQSSTSWYAPNLFFGTDYVVALYEPINLDYNYTHLQIYQWIGEKWVLSFEERLNGKYYDNYKPLDYYSPDIMASVKQRVMSEIDKYCPLLGAAASALSNYISGSIKPFVIAGKDLEEGRIDKAIVDFFKGEYYDRNKELFKDIVNGFEKDAELIKKSIVNMSGDLNLIYTDKLKELNDKYTKYVAENPRKEFHITLQNDFFALTTSSFISTDNVPQNMTIYRKNDIVEGKWDKTIKPEKISGKFVQLQSGEKFISLLDEITDFVYIYSWDGEYWNTHTEYMSFDAYSSLTNEQLQQIFGSSDLFKLKDFNISNQDYLNSANQERTRHQSLCRSSIGANKNFICSVVSRMTDEKMLVKMIYHDEDMNWFSKEQLLLRGITVDATNPVSGIPLVLNQALLSLDANILVQPSSSFAAIQTYSALEPNFSPEMPDLIGINEIINELIPDTRKINNTFAVTWDKDFNNIKLNHLHSGVGQTDVRVSVVGNVINKIGRANNPIVGKNARIVSEDGVNYTFRYDGVRFTTKKSYSDYLSQAMGSDIVSVSNVKSAGELEKMITDFYEYDPNTPHILMSSENYDILANALSNIITNNPNPSPEIALEIANKRAAIDEFLRYRNYDFSNGGWKTNSIISLEENTDVAINSAVKLSADVVNVVINIILIVIPGLEEVGVLRAEAAEALSTFSNALDVAQNLMMTVQPLAKGVLDGIMEKNHYGSEVITDYISIGNKIYTRNTQGVWSEINNLPLIPEGGSIIGNQNAIKDGYYPITTKTPSGEIKNFVHFIKNGRIYRTIPIAGGYYSDAIIHADTLDNVYGADAFVSYGPIENNGYVKRNTNIPIENTWSTAIGELTGLWKDKYPYKHATKVRLHKLFNSNVYGQIEDYVVNRVTINDGFNSTYEHFLYESSAYETNSQMSTYGKVTVIPSATLLSGLTADNLNSMAPSGYETEYYFNRYNYYFDNFKKGFFNTLTFPSTYKSLEFNTVHLSQLDLAKQNPILQLYGMPYYSNVVKKGGEILSENFTGYKIWHFEHVHLTQSNSLSRLVSYPIYITNNTSVHRNVITWTSNNYDDAPVVKLRSISSFSVNPLGQLEELKTTYTYAYELNNSMRIANRLNEVANTISYLKKGAEPLRILSAEAMSYKDLNLNNKIYTVEEAHYTAKLSDQLVGLEDTKIRDLVSNAAAQVSIHNNFTSNYLQFDATLSSVYGMSNEAKKAVIEANKITRDNLNQFETVKNQMTQDYLSLQNKIQEKYNAQILSDKQVEYNSKLNTYNASKVNYNNAITDLNNAYSFWFRVQNEFNELKHPSSVGSWFSSGFSLFGDALVGVFTNKEGELNEAKRKYQEAQQRSDELYRLQESARIELQQLTESLEFTNNQLAALGTQINELENVSNQSETNYSTALKNCKTSWTESYEMLNNKNDFEHEDLSQKNTNLINYINTSNSDIDNSRNALNNMSGSINNLRNTLTVLGMDNEVSQLLNNYTSRQQELLQIHTNNANSFIELKDRHIVWFDKINELKQLILSKQNDFGHIAQWIETSRNLTFDNIFGNPITSEDEKNSVSSVLLTQDNKDAIASFINADVNNNEANYLGFESYERIKGNTNDAHTGKQAFVCDKNNYVGISPLNLKIDLDKNSHVYVLSAWVKNTTSSVGEVGFHFWGSKEARSTVNTNTDKEYFEKETIAADGKWHFIEITVDIKEPFIAFASFNNTSLNSQLLFDDVMILPLKSRGSAVVYNDNKQIVANIGDNGDIINHYYDKNNEAILSIDKDDRCSPISVQYFSRNSSSESTFNSSSPNSLLTVNCNGKGKVLEDNVAVNTLNSEFCTGEDVVIGFSTPYNINFKFNNDGFQFEKINNIVVVSTDYTTGTPSSVEAILDYQPKEWNVIFFMGRYLIFCDGKCIISGVVYNTQFKGDIHFNSDRINDITGRYVISNPVFGIAFTNGIGNIIQTQKCEISPNFRNAYYDGKVVMGYLYNGWGLPELSTLPAFYGGKCDLRYEPNFIKSFDWTTGVMTGDVVDYYRLSNVRRDLITNHKDMDADYPYSRTKYEDSPLCDPYTISRYGADNNRIEETKTKFGYQDDLGQSLLSTLGIDALLSKYIVSKSTTSPQNIQNVTLNDNKGRVVGRKNAHTMEKYTYGFNDWNYSSSTRYLPLSFSAPGQVPENSFIHLSNQKDLLGIYSSIERPDEGVITTISNNSGQVSFQADNAEHSDGNRSYTPVDVYIKWNGSSGNNLIRIINSNDNVVWEFTDPERSFNGETGTLEKRIKLFLKPGLYNIECMSRLAGGWAKDGSGTAEIYTNGNYQFSVTNDKLDNSSSFYDLSINDNTPTSGLAVSITWPNYASENKVDIINSKGDVVKSYCKPDVCNKIDNVYASSYSFSEIITLPQDNYIARCYDAYGDGWNGNGKITITQNGIKLLDGYNLKTIKNSAGAYVKNGFSDINFSTNTSITQKSNVKVSVNWPLWCGENSVKFINTSTNIEVWSYKVPIGTGIDRTKGITIDLFVSLNPGNYKMVCTDAYGDGWNNSGTVSVYDGNQLLIDKYSHDTQFGKNASEVPFGIKKRYEAILTVNMPNDAVNNSIRIVDSNGKRVWPGDSEWFTFTENSVSQKYSLWLEYGDYRLEAKDAAGNGWYKNENSRSFVNIIYRGKEILPNYEHSSEYVSTISEAHFTFKPVYTWENLNPEIIREIKYSKYDELGRMYQQGIYNSNFKQDYLEVMANVSYWWDPTMQIRKIFEYDMNPDGKVKNSKGKLTRSISVMDNVVYEELYTYNEMGLLASMTQNVKFLKEEKVIKTESLFMNYKYNFNGTLSEIIYPNGLTVYRGYDRFNRLVSIGSALGSSDYASFSYDLFGSVKLAKYNNETMEKEQNFDLEHNLTKITYTKNSNGLKTQLYSQELSYYDVNNTYLNGNIAKITENQSAFVPATRVINYNYDGLYQLLNSTKTEGTSTVSSQFEYDLNGNIMKKIDVGSLSGTTNFTNNIGTNQRTSSKFTGSTGFISANDGYLQYDSEGRVSQMGTLLGKTGIIYDELTHLPILFYSKEDMSKGLKFGYNSENNRTLKIYMNSERQDTIVYMYAGNMLPMFEHHFGTEKGEKFDYYKIHIFGQTYSPIATHIVAESQTIVDKSGLYYYIKDHQGSIKYVTRTDNSMLDEYRYTAFGDYDYYSRSTISNSFNKFAWQPINNFGYTGQIYVPELGINYYNARMYSAKDGVFLTPDPAHQYANTYNYCGNNPINSTDPTGMVRRRMPAHLRSDESMSSPLHNFQAQANWAKLRQRVSQAAYVNKQTANKLGLPRMSSGARRATWLRRMNRQSEAFHPDPEAYLPKLTYQAHLAQFESGAHTFMPEHVFDQMVNFAKTRDQSIRVKGWGFNKNFVTPLADADRLISGEAGRDFKKLESALGVDPGYWSNAGGTPRNQIYRFVIHDPTSLGLSLPKGTEGSAFQQEWFAGGYTLGGAPEAIIDHFDIDTFIDHVRMGKISISKYDFSTGTQTPVTYGVFNPR